MAQQQIVAMRERATALGLDEADLPAPLNPEDSLPIVGWSEVGKFWALCCGDEQQVVKLCSRLNLAIVDKRSDAPWPSELDDLKMVLPPKPNQVEPFEQWRKSGHGIFKASPAFGKTFLLIWYLLTTRQNALVLVHLDGLASQFITRFRHGSPQGGSFTPITNCLEVEGRLGRKIIGPLTPDVLTSTDAPLPVTVATWQSILPLIKSGRDLTQFTKKFGRLLVDEAHTFASKSAFQVINLFPCRRLGVTATPTRKDQLHKGLHYIIGPVTATGSTTQVPVRAFFIQTDTVYTASTYPRRGEWAYLLSYLVKQADRNDKIVAWVQHDVALGRTLLLSCDRMRWCFEMAERLRRLGISAKAVVGKSKMKPAEREAIVSEVLSGQVSVLCATQAFKIGLDLPTLDTLYCILPMANPEGLEQILGRIRRPVPGRKCATFRYFVDDGSGLIRGCARSTHRDVSELGAEVAVVPSWHKPAETVENKPKSKLAKIASRDPWLFNRTVFDSKAPASEQAYLRRMEQEE